MIDEDGIVERLTTERDEAESALFAMRAWLTGLRSCPDCDGTFERDCAGGLFTHESDCGLLDSIVHANRILGPGGRSGRIEKQQSVVGAHTCAASDPGPDAISATCDACLQTSKEEHMKKRMRITLTQKQAEMLGIVFCKCGHPPNNHFGWDKRPCAHCKCQSYRQVISLPQEQK